MINNLKSKFTNLIPKKQQVPFKYYLDIFRGYHEEELQLLKYMVSKGDLVVDVGGNRGQYSYKLWSLGCRVEAFEPNPLCFSILSAWAKNISGINVHSVALSDKKDSTILNIPIDKKGHEHDASASIEHNDFTNFRKQTISTSTLDSCNLKDIRLIKIDVEGHEAKVLLGASQTIKICKPALIIEIEQRHLKCPISDVFEYIKQLGYEGYYLLDKQLYNLESFNVNANQSINLVNNKNKKYINNFIFLHKSRVKHKEYSLLVNKYIRQ